MSDDLRIGGGFTEGELKVASFWVRNRLLLRKVGHTILIVANTLVWGYVSWGLLDAYAISYPRESRITADIARNQFLATQLSSNRPQNVETGQASVFQSTDDRLDFLVPVNNPNTEWWVEYTYHFNVSGEATPARSASLLPGEKSYVGEFGFKPETKGTRSGTPIFDNIRWHRLDPAVVGADYKGWLERRSRFRTEDATFVSEGAGTQQLSRSHFTLVNDSAYGFWSVPLYIVLKRGGASIAATSIVLNNVKPGERREVNVDWYDRLPGVTQTEVVPVVNYLDSSAYLPTSQLK